MTIDKSHSRGEQQQLKKKQKARQGNPVDDFNDHRRHTISGQAAVNRPKQETISNASGYCHRVSVLSGIDRGLDHRQFYK